MLERTVDELAGGGLRENARLESQAAAHNLAGSLGSFGLPRGTELAREVEGILAAGHPLRPQLQPRG